MYQLIKNFLTGETKIVKRLSDNAFIPFEPANTDYQVYLKWVAEGGVPIPADEQNNG
jgi:hypothetical protein